MFGWFKENSTPTSNGPDFSSIDSRAKAQKLVRSGDLEKLFLLPPEFGGKDEPQNTLFVPVGLAAVKAGIDKNVIAPLVADGKITKYQATPEYQGKSFIPIAIKIVASEPGRFETTLNIWGEALGRDTEPGQMPEHAVIVRFDYGKSNLDALHEVEDRLTQALAETGLGECDGNDVTPDLSKATLYLYGPDAERIFAVAEPILVRSECVCNGMATLRFGPPEDGVPERIVRLAAPDSTTAEDGSWTSDAYAVPPKRRGCHSRLA